MQAEKGQIGTDFVYQNSCHKENCVNVCPFWDQTAPRKPLAYDLALSGIRPQTSDSTEVLAGLVERASQAAISAPPNLLIKPSARFLRAQNSKVDVQYNAAGSQNAGTIHRRSDLYVCSENFPSGK